MVKMMEVVWRRRRRIEVMVLWRCDLVEVGGFVLCAAWIFWIFDDMSLLLIPAHMRAVERGYCVMCEKGD